MQEFTWTPKGALHKAVNDAIDNGAPIVTEQTMDRRTFATTNSFQKWACATLRDAGISRPVVFTGNWIEIGGEPIMTEQGVRAYIAGIRSAS